MKLEAAVIGKPISHSLSPSIFGFLAHHLNVTQLDYRAREVGQDELPGFIETFRSNPNALGLNVTIPNKEAILPLLDDVSSEAHVIGAVNVVHRQNGRLKGYNTDVYGILRTFEKHSVSVRDQHVLMIGAGGAARAVAYALCSEKAKSVTLLSPNLARAKALLAAFQPHFKETQLQVVGDWKDLPAHEWSLVVQSTPLGMGSQLKTKDGIPAADYYSHLRKLKYSARAAAFDLIYRPEWTPFLEQAQQLKLQTIGGLDMLIEQALETWRIWFNSKPIANLSDYLRYRPIFLTGFMGAGKSTIGPLLAKKLGWNFIETDLEIEKEAGLSIPEIFRLKGEPGFRQLENLVITRHAFAPRSVVSLGGGSLTHSETRTLLQKTGRLVWLTADPLTLNQRLKTQSNERPLLAGLSDKQRFEKIESLLKEREPFYNLASLKLDTAAMSAEQVADKIRETFL